MNRFVQRRLAGLEKLVAVTKEPIPRITPDMTVEQAMEIWTRTLRYRNSLPPAFSEKEIEEARRGRTGEELEHRTGKMDPLLGSIRCSSS